MGSNLIPGWKQFLVNFEFSREKDLNLDKKMTEIGHLGLKLIK